MISFRLPLTNWWLTGELRFEDGRKDVFRGAVKRPDQLMPSSCGGGASLPLLAAGGLSIAAGLLLYWASARRVPR
jgi:hypothetical protein